MTEIISLDQVEKASKDVHKKAQSIVLTGGCFDILHIGHFSLLEGAKKEGDILMVLLESDDAIKAKKGINRPIHTQEQRARMLAAIRFVDYVITLPSSMKDSDYDTVVIQVQPAIIAATFGDPNSSHKERQAEKTNAKLVYVNHLVKNISTTAILDLLAKEA